MMAFFISFISTSYWTDFSKTLKEIDNLTPISDEIVNDKNCREITDTRIRVCVHLLDYDNRLL